MWRIIKKSIKIFVISVIAVVLSFSNFPLGAIKDYLDEQNIVDNFYWSAKLSNVVDKLSVKTAHANPGTRSRTVEFFAGQLLGTQAGQQTNTQYNFATFNVNLYENTVSVKNAFVEFEGQIGAYVSEAVPGFVLYFDSCTSPCTPTPTAFTTNTGGLGASSTEEQTLTARADVITETQLAAYTGAGGTLVAQVGYKDSFTTAQATWQSTQARLIITYTYDDASTTQTNTIYYPLESQASGDQGSRGASQASGCTLGTNCPTFNYNIVAPEISSQLSQWFAINGSIAGGSTTTDYQSTVRVDTNTASSIMWFEETLSVNGGGFRYLMSGLTGHTNNAAHYIERTGTPHTLYVMGGEAALTYSYLNSAGTKTKTVRYPVGEVQTAANSTAKTALTGPNVYLPESGVAIQKAWFRITTSFGTAADTLAITTKVGNNTETAAKNYSVAPPTQNVTDDNMIYHVIPAVDYTELQAATASSAKAVQMTSQWTTGAGAVSAELVITYTYTGEASGYQTTLQAFAGQHTGAPATTFTTATGAIGTEMPEANGKQVNGAFLKMSRNKLITVNEAMGANLTTSTCTATNTSTGESDNENSRISLYKSVNGVITTSDTATYTACYSAGTASTFTGALVYTYQRTPPITTLATGSDPAANTIAPGASATDVDQFTLQTNAGTETLTSVTVNLSTNNGVLRLAITTAADAELGFTTSPVTGSNTISVSGMTAGTSVTTFKVRVTPLIHSAMPPPPCAGCGYAITAPVTSWAGDYANHTGSDTNLNALTIDNASPSGATLVSGTAGDTAITVNWRTSDGTNGPFDTTNGSVIYRWQAASAGSETPDEGDAAPVVGSADGTATVACVISSAISTDESKVDGTGGSAGCTTAALTNGLQYTYKVFSRDTRGNYDVGVLIGTFIPAAATVITVDEIGTQSSPLIIPSTGNYIGGAFTMIRGSGTANVTSITITESGTVDALTNLNNIKLQYDLDTVSPYNCASETYNALDTQYGATDTNGFSAINGISTFTGSVAVSDVQAMCVYVVLDVLSGASDGQTMIIRINNPSTDVLVSAGTVSPATPQGLGTTTLEVPKITVGTEGTQANMIIGTGDNNVGGAFTFTRNTGSANVTQIIITDDTGTVNANLNISDVVVFYKQEGACSASIPVDATQFNTPGVGFAATEKATVTGTMTVGTAKICVYVRVDVGDGATNGQTLEIQIANPSTEVTVSAGTVTPATAVSINGTTTLNSPTYTSQGIPFLYTANNWGTGGSGVSFYLEVYMRQTTGTVYARLLNETDTTAVSGSTLSTTSASFTRLRTSSALTMTDGKVYRVQFGKIGADAGETLGGKLIVNQNQVGGGGGGDIAETYFSEDDSLTAGDVVALDETKNLFVQKSKLPYDRKLIGVISTSPKIVLGEENSGMVPVALLGRVPVKVNLEGGPIEVGDSLTSSSTSGVAMKATQAGRVIGMALEEYNPSAPNDDPNAQNIGQILVFVNPHWFAGLEIIGSSTSDNTDTDTGGITGKIQEMIESALASFGIFVENGVARFMDLTARKIVVERLEVKEAAIETAQIGNLEVLQKIKLRDFITNELYCAWIELGEWKKEKCDNNPPINTNTQLIDTNNNPLTDTNIQPIDTDNNSPTDTNTQPIDTDNNPLTDTNTQLMDTNSNEETSDESPAEVESATIEPSVIEPPVIESPVASEVEPSTVEPPTVIEPPAASEVESPVMSEVEPLVEEVPVVEPSI